MLLVQLLQLLRLVFDQQVALLVLKHKTELRYFTAVFYQTGLWRGYRSRPAAAAARGCWRHTGAAGLSSGFRASAVGAAARSSASSLPELRTGDAIID